MTFPLCCVYFIRNRQSKRDSIFITKSWILEIEMYSSCSTETGFQSSKQVQVALIVQQVFHGAIIGGRFLQFAVCLLQYFQPWPIGVYTIHGEAVILNMIFAISVSDF